MAGSNPGWSPATTLGPQVEGDGSGGGGSGGGRNGAGGGGRGRSDRRRERPASRAVIEWAVILIIAVLAAFLIRAFVFQTFFIPSGSMEPTLNIGDRIVVSKLSYDLHSVDRGNIVVFARPPKEDCGGPPVADLVKRVIGLPGETVSGVGGGVDIDGKPLAEPWLPKEHAYTAPFSPIKVPKGEYFVMGDNRTNSCDSRDWGPFPGNLIVGKVVLRIWPISGIKFFF